MCTGRRIFYRQPTLAKVFSAYGYDSIHVKSKEHVPEVLLRTYLPSDFVSSGTYDGDVERLIHSLGLRSLEIKCVVAGSEMGVVVADLLSEALGVSTNGSRLSEARRNKSLMGDVVREAGLRAIPQLETECPTQLREWLESGGYERFVLKPLAGSGGHGFHLCNDIREAEAAFSSLRSEKDIFGSSIEKVLVQECIEGEEFCVNTVSMQGCHRITDVWHTKKKERAHAKIYDLETLVDYREPQYRELIEYVFDVLAALGIKNGPAHSEVIVDSTGPVLVEVGARFMGSTAQSLISEVYGTNSVLLTAESVISPHLFEKRMIDPHPERMRWACMVQLHSKAEGIMKGYKVDRLLELPSFHGVDLYLNRGDRLTPTVDSYSSPGLVFLCGTSPDRLWEDYHSIRRLEQEEGLYDLEPE